MQTATLILANILLLLLMIAGICVERRVSRLELTKGRQGARLRELRSEVEELKARVAYDEEADAPESDARRAKDAERRFNEGVASILGYGLRIVGQEAEHDENS